MPNADVALTSLIYHSIILENCSKTTYLYCSRNARFASNFPTFPRHEKMNFSLFFFSMFFGFILKVK